MNKSHLDSGFEIARVSLKNRTEAETHETLRSRGYSESDCFLCIQAGLLLREYDVRKDQKLEENL